MSLVDSLAILLSDMGFAQLGLAFVIVGAYALALNGSLDGTVRSGAGSVAFAASAAFAALTESWMGGVAFLAVVVVGVAAFVAAAWLFSVLLGLGATNGAASVGGVALAGAADPARDGRADAPLPHAARGLATSSAFGAL